MKRREFITLLGGVVALLVAAQAQQPAKMKRIALVHTSEPVANMVASYQRTYRAFFDEVSRLGFVEGKNLVVERYSAGGLPDRYGQFVRDVVDTHPDAILSGESVLGLAFKAATTTIPIITVSPDPVALGLVSNIARPGGNLTGTALNAGLEIWGKRIGLLKEALPKLSNVCILAQTRKGWEGPFGSAVRLAAKGASMAYSSDLEELGRSLGSQIAQILNGTNPRDIPYNQVTRYELALNLKTARLLGIEFPATLLGSADLIVE